MRFAAAFISIALLFTGCSSTTSYRSPGADLAGYKRVWVEKNLSDDHRINEMIASELTALGYEVESGFETMRPRGFELIVTYEDEWAWDFKTYLIDISVTVRETGSSRVIASGRYFRPGVTNKAPAAMVREVVQSIFKIGKK